MSDEKPTLADEIRRHPEPNAGDADLIEDGAPATRARGDESSEKGTLSIARKVLAELRGRSDEDQALLIQRFGKGIWTTAYERGSEELDAARMANEANRTLWARCLTALDETFKERFWLIEGRGPYEWDDDRFREEFVAVKEKVLNVLRPLRNVAFDKTNSPVTPEGVALAREQLAVFAPHDPDNCEHGRRGREEGRRAGIPNLLSGSILKQDNRITSEPIFLVEERDWHDSWKFVTCCFTEKGAQDYIDCNRHNLNQPRIYVASGYRNAEWMRLRAFFKANEALLSSPTGVGTPSNAGKQKEEK